MLVQRVATRKKTNIFSAYRQVLNDGSVVYAAGFPHYPRNFSRDAIIAGVLASSARLIKSQLEFSAKHQGARNDPITGEQPGRIHHELPGVPLVGRLGLTTYNSCDSTALFLIGVEGLEILDRNAGLDFIGSHKAVLEKALDYILDRVHDDHLFYEHPPEGAEHFALQVTYIKDSILPRADGKTEPKYPVVYPLAHFMAARSLLSASLVLHDQTLATLADKMYKAGIKEFIRPDAYVVYRDAEGDLLQSASDELHNLAYIPQKYKYLLPLDQIKKRAEILETPFGYVCIPVSVAKHLTDGYHGDKVWVFEQAFIHYGATRFGLEHEAAVASSVVDFIGEGQELLAVTEDSYGRVLPVPNGNDRQLLSVAAGQYFAGKTLLANPWL